MGTITLRIFKMCRKREGKVENLEKVNFEKKSIQKLIKGYIIVYMRLYYIKRRVDIEHVLNYQLVQNSKRLLWHTCVFNSIFIVIIY